MAPALEHNGDLYSCDHFVEPKYKLGNIHEKHMLEMVASPEQRKFGDDKRDTSNGPMQALRGVTALQRRLSEGSIFYVKGRRTRTELPLLRLGAFLQAHAAGDEEYDDASPTGPGTLEHNEPKGRRGR